MNFDELKAQMGKLNEVAKDLQTKEVRTSKADERMFKPKADSAGNISCVIRFLPQLDFSKSPYVEKPGHYIKSNSKIFACACSEFEEKGSCAVCGEAQPHWKDYFMYLNAHGKEHSSTKAAQKQANMFSRNVQTITNILVVKNPAEPETEGKVFLYAMPKNVVEKYKQKLMPKDEMDERVIIYHPLEGRNFKLEAFMKDIGNGPMPDYKNSYFFDKSTPISEDENLIMKYLNETYDLLKYMEETKIDREDVKKRFREYKKFLGLTDDGSSERKEATYTNKEESTDEELEVTEVDDIDDLFD